MLLQVLLGPHAEPLFDSAGLAPETEDALRGVSFLGLGRLLFFGALLIGMGTQTLFHF